MIGQNDPTIRLNVTKTLSASNTTGVVDLFNLTGSVRVKKLFGQVTAKTTLTNMTDCHWNLNDATSDVAITKATTLTMSTAVVGAVVEKTAAVASVAAFASGAAGALTEGSTPIIDFQFVITQKNGATTKVQWKYTTTDAPINATMKFFVEFESINGGNLTAL